MARKSFTKATRASTLAARGRKAKSTGKRATKSVGKKRRALGSISVRELKSLRRKKPKGGKLSPQRKTSGATVTSRERNMFKKRMPSLKGRSTKRRLLKRK